METGTRPAAEGLRAEVRETVADLIGVAATEIADDVNLVLLGLGSLQVMRQSSRWRRAGTPVDFDTLVAEPTVAAWARHLEEVRSAQPQTGAAAADGRKGGPA